MSEHEDTVIRLAKELVPGDRIQVFPLGDNKIPNWYPVTEVRTPAPGMRSVTVDNSSGLPSIITLEKGQTLAPFTPLVLTIPSDEEVEVIPRNRKTTVSTKPIYNLVPGDYVNVGEFVDADGDEKWVIVKRLDLLDGRLLENQARIVDMDGNEHIVSPATSGITVKPRRFVNDEEIDKITGYHPPKDDTIRQGHEMIRSEFNQMMRWLNEVLPECPQKTHLLRQQLPQCMYSANGIVAREQKFGNG